MDKPLESSMIALFTPDGCVNNLILSPMMVMEFFRGPGFGWNGRTFHVQTKLADVEVPLDREAFVKICESLQVANARRPVGTYEVWLRVERHHGSMVFAYTQNEYLVKPYKCNKLTAHEAYSNRAHGREQGDNGGEK